MLLDVFEILFQASQGKANRLGQEELRVARCYITTNGNVMSFDANGEQIPECQGFILDIAETLKTRCDEDTEWGFARWRKWKEDADFSWWWREKK